jgi:putative transposase
MKVVCAYKYALDPNSSAELALYAHCGAARFAFNHMLAHVKAVHDQRAAEQSYGLVGDELTPAVNWTAYGLRKVWNQRKHQVAVAAIPASRGGALIRRRRTRRGWRTSRRR